VPGGAWAEEFADRRDWRTAGGVQHGALNSEKLMEASGISIETLDLSEVLGRNREIEGYR